MTAESATSPLVLRRLSTLDDLSPVAALMVDYIAEIRRNLLEGHGLQIEEATPDSGKIVDLADLLEPPQCLYLAEIDGRPAGTCGLLQITSTVAEVKRMYVDPAARRHGVARALLEQVIADARAAGYLTLRLETAVWMVEAHALYGSCGFVEIPPFPDAEFGCYPGLEHLGRYMALSLDELA